MPTADDVRRAVEAAFPEPLRPRVLAALKRYTPRREASRVRLAILVLADGDPADIEDYVRHANGDYRDVLAWAESPQEFGTGTRAGMAARYRRLGVPVPDDLR